MPLQRPRQPIQHSHTLDCHCNDLISLQIKQLTRCAPLLRIVGSRLSLCSSLEVGDSKMLRAEANTPSL
ncbi:hypothetical protein ACKKBF_B39965 [Auxenochlorella protothecoides x Auxenochlorella symbiontica]